jgi:hypothetical protein
LTPAPKTRRRWTPILLLAAGILLHALVASNGWWNPIVERHGFRQTQTAISVLWLLRGSPSLAYETPVFGPPWSIPFEFPLCQWAVALLSRVSTIPIDQSGRIVNLLAFYLGLIPVAWLVRRLRLPAPVFAIFALLYLASPLDLYWPRTFLMESTAMTLSLAYFCVASVALYQPLRWRRWAAATILGILAALVKVTTFVGALLAVGLLFLYLWERRRPRILTILYGSVLLVLPLAAGAIWTRFADFVKLQNPLQAQTSGDLAMWNFGPLALRASLAFWQVLDARMMRDLLGLGWPIVALATIALAVTRNLGRRIGLAFFAAVAFCAGPLIFANLYYIHDYYPNGAAAYLYLSLAIIWGILWNARRVHRGVPIAVLVIFLVGSAFIYQRRFLPGLKMKPYSFTETGRFLKSTVPPEETLLIYGAHWDSTIGYYSEHRAIMDLLYRPVESAQIAGALEGLAPAQRIGAVVGCNEALDGWYLRRVLASVAATGMSPQPAYQDDLCRVYLPAKDRSASATHRTQPVDVSWLAMPNLGASPLMSQPKNPSLENRLIPIDPDPVRLAPIEGPGGKSCILANPDTRLALPLPADTAMLTIGYGIKDYAWRVRKMPPVTFAVYSIDGDQKRVIWQRSLDPANHAGDRGEQFSPIQITPETRQVILETASSNTSISNRAYWSSLEIR